MDRIARDQGNDMKASIAQAEKSATEMVRIADALIESAKIVQKSLEITIRIAETNERLANNTAPRERL